MKSSQLKKATSAAASSHKITDFFRKPTPSTTSAATKEAESETTANSATVAQSSSEAEAEVESMSKSTSQTTPAFATITNSTSTKQEQVSVIDVVDEMAMDVDVDHRRRNSLPLFDPADDNDDNLGDDPVDFKSDLSVLEEIKAVVMDRDRDRTRENASNADTPVSTVSSTVCTKLSKSPQKKCVVFEEDDDDLDILLGSSYDFVSSSSDYKPESKIPQTPSTSSISTSTSTTKTKKLSQLEKLDSIMGTSKRSSKHAFSLDSLLKDKMKREKQIEEAKAIDSMLKKTADENSDPDVNASSEKYLDRIIGDLDDNTSTTIGTPATTRKKRKARDVESDADSDDDDIPAEIKSTHALQKNKKRMQEMVVEMMKGGSVESLIVFDAIEELKRPSVVLKLDVASDDQIGQTVAQALGDANQCEQFLLSGALGQTVTSSKWNYPENLCEWLFDIACYSSSETMASSAAKSLTRYFEALKDQSWIITPSVFKQALTSYGFHTNIFDSNGGDITSFIKSVPRLAKQNSQLDQLNINSLHSFNLSLCVELYISCLTNRWKHYPEKSLEDALILLVKLSVDNRVVFATAGLLADSIAKIARVLTTDESLTDTSPSFQYIVDSLAVFAGSDPLWQDALICKPSSALVGSIAASVATGCPLRNGVGFMFRVRKAVAAICVVKSGDEGGFRKSEDGDSNGVGFGGSEESVSDTSFLNLTNVVSKYSVVPTRTDFMRLASRIQVLSVAVGGVSGVKENLADATEMKTVLDRMHGSISDTSQLAMDRVWAKECIHDLKTFIELCLPRKANQQTSVNEYFK